MLDTKNLFFDNFLYYFGIIIFLIMPVLSMEESNEIHLEYINSQEKFEDLLSKYPVLVKQDEEQERSRNKDQGFVELPRFILKEEKKIWQAYPVQGMWIIIKGENNSSDAIGRISLSVRGDKEVHINSWIDSKYRKQGFGEKAHHLIFKAIEPYIGKEIKYIKENRYGTEEKSLKFDGIFIDIVPSNYASIISYLRAGSGISGYRQPSAPRGGLSHELINSLILHYPIEEISNEKLESDHILKILKEEVEPYIINEDTRQNAIKELESISSN